MIIKIDKLKTFDDVVNLAKELLNWQKKEVENLKKLPEFDLHKIAQNYGLNDDETDSDETQSSEDTQNTDDKSEDKLDDKVSGDYEEAEDNGEDKKDTTNTGTQAEAQEGGVQKVLIS